MTIGLEYLEHRRLPSALVPAAEVGVLAGAEPGPNPNPVPFPSPLPPPDPILPPMPSPIPEGGPALVDW